jgi:hypothetical protein
VYYSGFITKLLIRVLIGGLLLLLLGGCNSPSSKQAETTPGSTLSNKNAFPSSVQITIPDLFTIASFNSTRSDEKDPYFAPGQCDNVVLATNRLTYTHTELQQMYSYLYGTPKSTLPPTLKWIDGGSTATDSNLSTWLPKIQDCTIAWEITNIGQKPIQLVQMGMKLLANTTEDSTQHRLVEGCSILHKFDQSAPCGTGGRPSPVQYTFGFGPGKVGFVIQGQSAVGKPVINPGDTLVLIPSFLETNPSDSLIYTFEPEVVINYSGKDERVIDLPEWKETLVMAPIEHFSCYYLQGDTFISVASLPSTTPGLNCI